MSDNGELALARALDNLTKTHINTQLTVQSNMLGSAFDYLYVVRGCSKTLLYDQLKCAYYNEWATTGNETDAAEAAKWHAQYQVDSTKMNHEMGREDAVVNTNDMMVHTQAENLSPVYSVLEYVALVFLTTSGLITR